MSGYNFPDAPTTGQQVTGTNGAIYRWTSAYWVAVGASGGGGIPEAPTDGRLYERQGSTASWIVGTGGGGGGSGAPANIGAPAITPSGSAAFGTLLTCSTGSWTNSPLGYNYQWQNNAGNIVGATSSTYTVQSTDAGGPLICNVVAVNGAGASLPASSNAVSVVGPPNNTILPSILGANTVGTTLTCSPGTWTNSPSLAYQWTRDGGNIGGATASTYTVLSGDASHVLACVVTGTNGSGSNSATAPSITIQGPPVNTVAPVISGTAQIKQILTVTNNGTWLGGPTFTYQWQRGGVDIAGASGATYQTIYIDGGTTITCNVTGHNSFGTGAGTSNGIAVAVPYSFPAGASGIYSTRLARSAYGLGSKCVKITRFSDNTTSDIGFNQFGDLDITTALGFAGGSMLSVNTWYDQSGNGNDLVQSTILSQPELLNINSQPYLAFNLTGSSCRLATSAAIGLTGDQTIGGVFQLHTPVAAAVPISCHDATNGGWYLQFNGAGHGSAGYFSTGGGALNDSTNLFAGSVHRVGITRTSGTLALVVDGVQTVTSSAQTNAAATTPMTVGMLAENPSVQDFEGLMGELYVYPSAQTLTSIQTSEAAYFPATGFQNYYNGAHAFEPSAATELLFGNVLRFEYTQPWTMFAQIQCYSHLGEQAEAALWSNIYHADPFIGYIVAVVLNVGGGTLFKKGAINCRVVNNLGVSSAPHVATLCGTTDVVDGRPHLISVSWDGSGIANGFKIYIDGVLETTTIIVEDDLAGHTILDPRTDGFQQIVACGMQVNDNGNQLKGRVGFLQVDKVVRNQTYITNNFSPAHPGPPPNDATAVTGTVFRLMFNEGSGTTVHDTGAIGTALAGTITTFSGSAWVP